MKKLLSLSPAKIYLTCALGLFVTLGAFWHHQINQTQLDRMNLLNQGVGTCFNRISQTFTAMMIKDIQSPYLNRGFMGLSDECLNETIKGINPFQKNVGKGYQTLNQLISEVHWFHEKVLKDHSPMLAGKNLTSSLTPLSDRFSKMENYKLNLVDEIDFTNSQIRQIQVNDEFLMAAGLIVFVLSLSILSLQEFNRIQLHREIEREALNYLKAGQANVGAIVDRLVDRALTSQGMPVTAQIFHDYHGNFLERFATKNLSDNIKVKAQTDEIKYEADFVGTKTSLKEVLVSVQNIHAKDIIHMSEVRDVLLNVPYEAFEQMMSGAIIELASKRTDQKKIMISNQIHSDKSVINFFLAGSTFTAGELEFIQNADALTPDLNMNLIILKEMVNEAGAQWQLENKTDRNGKIIGMNIRFSIARVPKERSKNLVSVMKGKKKDLSKELMN